jgi:hypothetical protein
MFGNSRPVVFKSYARRRSSWRLPRWFVLLLSGIAIGAACVVVVQERYLPPRLSADASERLNRALEESDAERLKLRSGLGQVTKRLESALADRKGLADDLAASRAAAERLRDDVASAVASLPPDPRGGAVEVRAGRFTAKAGMLAYEVVLTRQHATAKPWVGVMQLVMNGESAQGAAATVTLNAVPLSFSSHEIVRGSLPLPEGFRPRRATIQVLDRAAAKPLGMRVMLVS